MNKIETIEAVLTNEGISKHHENKVKYEVLVQRFFSLNRNEVVELIKTDENKDYLNNSKNLILALLKQYGNKGTQRNLSDIMQDLNFGDYEGAKALLNGISINYPEIITVGFTHDLENVTIKPIKVTYSKEYKTYAW